MKQWGREGGRRRGGREGCKNDSFPVLGTRERLTLCLVGQELVHLSNGPVVGTNHESVVVHVENYVLALCACVFVEEREQDNADTNTWIYIKWHQKPLEEKNHARNTHKEAHGDRKKVGSHFHHGNAHPLRFLEYYTDRLINQFSSIIAVGCKIHLIGNVPRQASKHLDTYIAIGKHTHTLPAKAALLSTYVGRSLHNAGTSFSL